MRRLQHRPDQSALDPRFCQSKGRWAKTDRIDANLLASYGVTIAPEPSPVEDQKAQTFKALCARRRQLLQMRTQELIRKKQVCDKMIARMIAANIQGFNRQPRTIEKVIDAIIDQTPVWQRKRQIIQSVPGLARTTARTLIADLPELGNLNDKKIAAMVGVAPFNHDSGKLKGYRAIIGGRNTVRTLIYMVAMGCATRNNQKFKAA